MTSKCDVCLQEGLERVVRELRICYSVHGAGKAHGSDYPEHHHTTLKGQPGDQASSVGGYQREVLLDKSDLLRRQGDVLSG